MRAGALSRRVTILRRTLARNSYGEEVEEYEELDTVWAQKQDISGREYMAAQGTHADATTRFRMRWRDDLSVTDRLAYGGHVYDIKHLAELGRREALDVVAVMRDT